MNKRKIALGGLITVGALILIGVALLGYFMIAVHEDTAIDINLKEEGSETLTFKNFELIPGEKTEYTVTLKSELDGKYKVELDFNDKDADLTLKNYICVMVKLDGEEVYDKWLADALKDKPETFEIEMKTNTDVKLEVIYYMPDSVGNEAENAAADFELKINYTNE